MRAAQWYYPGTPDPLNIPAELSGITSPTQSPIKDSGIGSNGAGNNDEADAAAAALATEMEEEVGMTTERQREIQASLFKMLGQADTEEDDGGNGDSNDDSDGGDDGVKFLKVNQKS